MARKFTYDEQKVKELRMEVIHAALEVMQEKKSVERWSQYKKDMILKIAPRVLPVLNEHTGRDGGAINIREVAQMSDEKLAKIAGLK